MRKKLSPPNIDLSIQDDFPITKCKPGHMRKALRYGYKRPSKRLSRLSDLPKPEKHATNEDYIDAKLFKMGFYSGSESEHAQQEALASAAEKFDLSPFLDNAPKDCSSCGNVLAGEKPRVFVLRVYQNSVGDLAGMQIRRTAAICIDCDGGGTSGKPLATDADEGWRDLLDFKERRVLQMKEQGMTRKAIEEKTGRSQATLTRVLSRIEGKRSAYKVSKLQTTGGI